MLTDFNSGTRYEIKRKIAEGGMGAVYEAMQIGVNGFQKKVAVKTLKADLVTDKRFVSMFIEEAKLVANLVHENIVQIYQLGQLDDGAYYFVMEYVNGISLKDFIAFICATKTLLPQELAIFIVSRIARGLAYAHSRTDDEDNHLKILHRDVSPTNILITTEGLPKLTDFGIAKAATNTIEDPEYQLMGKLTYMAPEQAKREPLDHRVDIYALGVILYELLTMESPRDGSDTTLFKAAQTGWINWEPLRKRVDDEMFNCIRKLLSLKPEDRYQDTSDFARYLEYYIYRGGYGPTIVTLEHYLKKHFTYLFTDKPKIPDNIQNLEKTVILPQDDID